MVESGVKHHNCTPAVAPNDRAKLSDYQLSPCVRVTFKISVHRSTKAHVSLHYILLDIAKVSRMLIRNICLLTTNAWGEGE